MKREPYRILIVSAKDHVVLLKTSHRFNIVFVSRSIGVTSFRFWFINHRTRTIHTTLSINFVVGIFTINTSSRRYRLAPLLDDLLIVILHEDSL